MEDTPWWFKDSRYECNLSVLKSRGFVKQRYNTYKDSSGSWTTSDIRSSIINPWYVINENCKKALEGKDFVYRKGKNGYKGYWIFSETVKGSGDLGKGQYDVLLWDDSN